MHYEDRPSEPIDAETCRAICREAAVVAKELTGRGPLSLKAFCSEMALVMIFRDHLTPLEQMLSGEASGRVRAMRRAAFEGNWERLAEIVERLGDVKVETVLWDLEPQDNVSAWFFVLEPGTGTLPPSPA